MFVALLFFALCLAFALVADISTFVWCLTLLPFCFVPSSSSLCCVVVRCGVVLLRACLRLRLSLLLVGAKFALPGLWRLAADLLYTVRMLSLLLLFVQNSRTLKPWRMKCVVTCRLCTAYGGGGIWRLLWCLCNLIFLLCSSCFAHHGWLTSPMLPAVAQDARPQDCLQFSSRSLVQSGTMTRAHWIRGGQRFCWVETDISRSVCTGHRFDFVVCVCACVRVCVCVCVRVSRPERRCHIQIRIWLWNFSCITFAPLIICRLQGILESAYSRGHLLYLFVLRCAFALVYWQRTFESLAYTRSHDYTAQWQDIKRGFSELLFIDQVSIVLLWMALGGFVGSVRRALRDACSIHFSIFRDFVDLCCKGASGACIWHTCSCKLCSISFAYFDVISDRLQTHIHGHRRKLKVDVVLFFVRLRIHTFSPADLVNYGVPASDTIREYMCVHHVYLFLLLLVGSMDSRASRWVRPAHWVGKWCVISYRL